MRTQSEKGQIFRSLHEREGAFILPNPWDIGTARLLASMGFEALGTTSAGYAFSIGQQDQMVPRDAMMAHLASIASATDLPTSGDLRNGFGDDPEAVAKTIREVSVRGLVGGSIEDSTERPGDPIYEINHAVDRIEAAAEACRALPFPFTLTARADNYLYGRRDLNDTILRLRSYQEAGANVLYAPGLTTKEEIRAVVHSVDRPVCVLMGIKGVRLTLDELSEIGVKSVSTGSSLARAALGTFLRVSRKMRNRGSFTHGQTAVGIQELHDLFQA